MTRNLDWWKSHLNNIKPAGDGFLAECPAHHDVKQSLSIKEVPGGEVLIHCFAGCKYDDILQSIESPETISISSRKSPSMISVGPSSQQSSRAWWEEYTRVPSSEWESWGVKFLPQFVEFTWKTSPAKKSRQSHSKNFKWEGAVSPPPFWPEVPESLPETIWISEGESDCGVLRHLGFEAFSITKGANAPLSPLMWEALWNRGARSVVLVFDTDSAGQEGALRSIDNSVESNLEVIPLDLSSSINALLGEKDVRDLYYRLGEGLHEVLEGLLTRVVNRRKIQRKLSLDEFLGLSIPETSWLVDKIWLDSTTGMISGPPKTGKSWLALDMGLSVATGSKFLGKYDVNPGPVALITSEDPDPLLQDRLQKMLMAKGLGGHIQGTDISFPPFQRTPFYLDLDRTFTFSPEGLSNLLKWLSRIYTLHHRLSLVIIDPILRFLPPGLDEYKASEVASTVFRATSKIYQEFGSSVLLVHHKSKAGSDSKGSYGSVAFGAFVESALYLTPTSENTRDWVNVLGEYKSAAQTKWSYRFPELENKYVVEVGGDLSVSSVSSRDLPSRVRSLLKESPEGLSVTDFLERIPEITESLIRGTLKTLEGQGVVYYEKVISTDKRGAPGPKSGRWFLRSV